MTVFNTFIREKYQIIVLFFFLILFGTSQVFASKFIIFHTSDVHGAIAPRIDHTSKKEIKPLIGGYAVLSKLIKNWKNDPQHVATKFLYFDCGDFFQGTPIVDKTKGQVMIDMLGKLEVNGVTLGNHEFDYSYQNLVKQLSTRDFSVICCNVFEKATGKLPKFADPYRIYTNRGKKIAVIGVDTPETASISFPDNVKDVIISDPVPIVKTMVKRLKRAGVDFIIVLSHLGYGADLKFASEIEGIDMILGGHSHKLMREIVYAPPFNTPVIHSGSSLSSTSVIQLDLTDANSPIIKFKSIPLYVDTIGEDPTMKALVDEYLHDLRATMKRIIGRSNVLLSRGIAGSDSSCGSLVANAMIEASGADIALINYGGVRQPLLPGDITAEDAFMIQPFDNKIEIIEMTGKQLRNLIECAYSNPPTTLGNEEKLETREKYNIDAEGIRLSVGPPFGILLPSGLHITYDPTWPPMQRIIQLTTDDGVKIENDRIYKVALNDFVGAGGDGFKLLQGYKKHATGILVRDALVKHIEKLKVIENKPNRRVYNVRLKETFID